MDEVHGDERRSADRVDAMEQPHVELKRARERKGLSLDALARVTGVRQAVLVSLEAGDYAVLPAGLYGRHAVRQYARAVGVDAQAAVAAAVPFLPAMDDPIAALARVRGLSPARSTAREAPISDRGQFSSGDRGVPPHAPGNSPASPALEQPAHGLAAAVQWHRLGASSLDALLLAGFAFGLAGLTAWAAGAPLEDVAPVAAPAWVLLILVTGAAYFALFGLVCQETLGTRVFPGATRHTGGVPGGSRRGSARQSGPARERELRDGLCF